MSEAFGKSPVCKLGDRQVNIEEDHTQQQKNEVELCTWLSQERFKAAGISWWKGSRNESSGCHQRVWCVESCLLSPGDGAKGRVFSFSLAFGLCRLTHETGKDFFSHFCLGGQSGLAQKHCILAASKANNFWVGCSDACAGTKTWKFLVRGSCPSAQNQVSHHVWNQQEILLHSQTSTNWACLHIH